MSARAAPTCTLAAVERYVIEGGRQGYDRLLVLAEAIGPGTAQLFDRVGLGPGMHCLDLGCGSGEVSFTIAQRVGPAGSVVGVDMDEVKLGLAREAAERRGLANVEFRHTNVNDWSDAGAYDLAYARMLLQHLRQPVDLLRRMWSAVRPGGVLAVEDADFTAAFCEPPLPAHDFFLDVYSEALRRRGGDPQIGRKLHRYFVAAGAGAPEVAIVQRVEIEGETTSLAHSTLAASADAIVGEGLATSEEIAEAVSALIAAAADPGTIMGLPRTFQAWTRKA